MAGVRSRAVGRSKSARVASDSAVLCVKSVARSGKDHFQGITPSPTMRTTAALPSDIRSALRTMAGTCGRRRISLADIRADAARVPCPSWPTASCAKLPRVLLRTIVSMTRTGRSLGARWVRPISTYWEAVMMALATVVRAAKSPRYLRTAMITLLVDEGACGLLRCHGLCMLPVSFGGARPRLRLEKLMLYPGGGRAGAWAGQPTSTLTVTACLAIGIHGQRWLPTRAWNSLSADRHDHYQSRKALSRFGKYVRRAPRCTPAQEAVSRRGGRVCMILRNASDDPGEQPRYQHGLADIADGLG